MQETNNILAILDNYLHDNPDEIAKEMANDFRKRRIEKNLTREQVADKSGVAVSNITRFEQKGLISLKNLIGIAIALDYTSEIKNVFSQPKYSTMEELQQIKRNANKKRLTDNETYRIFSREISPGESRHTVIECRWKGMHIRV